MILSPIPTQKEEKHKDKKLNGMGILSFLIIIKLDVEKAQDLTDLFPFFLEKLQKEGKTPKEELQKIYT